MSENETPADQVRSVMAKNLEQAQPPRLTRVRPVAERQALGRPQVGAGSMMNACNHRGFDPDRLRTPAASRGMLSAKQRVP